MALPKKMVGALILSVAGLAGVSLHEGRVFSAYRDPVGIVTICDGHTRTAKLGQVHDSATCDRLLREDTTQAQGAVRRLVKVPVTQGQYDTLVDFVFNKGEGAFATSTLLRKVNAGDCRGAGAEFSRWDKATKYVVPGPGLAPVKQAVVLPGLVKRAAAHRVAWEAGC